MSVHYKAQTVNDPLLIKLGKKEIKCEILPRVLSLSRKKFVQYYMYMRTNN